MWLAFNFFAQTSYPRNVGKQDVLQPFEDPPNSLLLFYFAQREEREVHPFRERVRPARRHERRDRVVWLLVSYPIPRQPTRRDVRKQWADCAQYPRSKRRGVKALSSCCSVSCKTSSLSSAPLRSSSGGRGGVNGRTMMRTRISE